LAKESSLFHKKQKTVHYYSITTVRNTGIFLGVTKTERSKLLDKLKEFYTLETFQVQYYKAQLSEAKNEYYRTAFERMVQIESGHADYFAGRLIAENEDVPVITGSVFKMAGRILGEAVELAGPASACKLGVALENKAIDKYREFIIKKWGDEELQSTLMQYLLDEECHMLWMKKHAETIGR
jgi:demethoxyubiquinone hydroxylase (CLK1/Coq7/Cat5 family)